MDIANLLGTLLASCLLVTCAKADISYTPGDHGTFAKIKIYGQIKKADAQQFLLLKDAAKISFLSNGQSMPDQWPMGIELDSMGGDVSAAISLGTAIRNANPLTVNVQEGATCVSACVLVLAGGVTRNVWGKVGIHRPYVDEDKAYTVTGQKQRYSEVETQIKDYLSSVNVPITLYDVMFRIPPEKVRFLSRAELQEYNLNEDDPYFKEARDASLAKSAGLSKSEYLKRKNYCHQLQKAKAITECLSQLLMGSK